MITIESGKYNLVKSALQQAGSFDESCFDVLCNKVVENAELVLSALKNEKAILDYLRTLIPSIVEEELKNINNSQGVKINIIEEENVQINNETVKPEAEPELQINDDSQQIETLQVVQYEDPLELKRVEQEYQKQQDVGSEEVQSEIEEAIPHDESLTRELLSPEAEEIFGILEILDKKYPDKKYLQIYNLRYIKKLPLLKVSEKLNLSENEISLALDRIFEFLEKADILD